MSFKPPQKAVSHMFMPGETVVAAIKKYNLYDLTKQEVDLLLREFKEHNTEIPRPGMRVLIPILERHQAAVFSSGKP